MEVDNFFFKCPEQNLFIGRIFNSLLNSGLLSTIETVYFGKPIVGTPVFYDQYLNMKLAESKGYGISVPFEQLNEQNLKTAIRNALMNPRFVNANDFFY